MWREKCCTLVTAVKVACCQPSLPTRKSFSWKYSSSPVTSSTLHICSKENGDEHVVLESGTRLTCASGRRGRARHAGGASALAASASQRKTAWLWLPLPLPRQKRGSMKACTDKGASVLFTYMLLGSYLDLLLHLKRAHKINVG